MKRTAMSTAVVLACGSAASATTSTPRQTPEPAPFGTEAGETLGHIYINMGTGERIVTRAVEHPVRARGASDSGPVWITSNGADCPGGNTPGAVMVVDEPDLDSDTATGAAILNWGDIAFDTVIDSVSMVYFTEHSDPDGAGVEGFGMTLHWFDIDNGNDFCGTYRVPVHSITLPNLPGDTDPGTPGMRGWSFTLDLASGFDEPQTFELGDTDGDPQGAAFFNAFDGFDFDGDGLHDFSYAVEFHQPGTTDFNGDGTPDGDPSAAARTGLALVRPSGQAVPIPDSPTNQWTVDPVDPPPAAQGMEDAITILTRQASGLLAFHSTIWFGGFSCDEQRPYAQTSIDMHGPAGAGNPCPVDLNNDGLVNFFDFQVFLDAFNNGDPLADWNSDGTLNVWDVFRFLSDFNAGCP